MNKLKKKSQEPNVDLSSCSHQGTLFRRERFQWHKVGERVCGRVRRKKVWEGEGEREGSRGG